MKSALRMRHWCDFCRKSGQVGARIAKHEAGCTLNPARKCTMCEKLGEVQRSIEELGKALREQGFKGLETAACSCPACILATLRQTNHGGWSDPDPDPATGWVESPDDDGRFAFDFKEACKVFWSEYNAEHQPY